ncbi:GDP-mannose-dependent alpha-(1-6)-phosphatidylinositol monomannoside mannosyltransferase [Ruegeria atlantica]|uniref:GDP-mannose-dependent alpha-(1-6)-phosphatidylinositol monomannoside mannosyltransferase n=1 Tax=Ruegeria atlantica TaxID=81569 RepID=A0A0P1EGJ8_9RHOB|nr:GDP-mannose-dependent alpha-(1-6)-phosphatidylinositol monomannoside mannosyltransferase [Ruegeria atlantica]
MMEFRILHWRRGLFADHLEPQFDCVQVNGRAKPIIRSDPGRWLNRALNLRSGNYVAANAVSIDEVSRCLEPFSPEVILAHFGYTALYMLPVAERLGVPIISHFHGTDVSLSLKRNRWYRHSLKNCLNRFSACIVVGSHQRKKLIELGADPNKTHLLPCGVPTDEFTPVQARSEDITRFVVIARLVEEKGVEISLRAFAKLSQRCTNLELLIIGDGPQRQALGDLANTMGVADKTKFMGYVKAEEVMAILQRCDVLLHHSLESFDWVEGFGVAVAEAGASGLPVVVSKSGGLVDLVVDGHTGFIVPLGNVDAMVNAMYKLHSDRELAREMGKNGRQRMVEQFDSRKLSLRLQKVLLDSVERLALPASREPMSDN